MTVVQTSRKKNPLWPLKAEVEEAGLGSGGGDVTRQGRKEAIDLPWDGLGGRCGILKGNLLLQRNAFHATRIVHLPRGAAPLSALKTGKPLRNSDSGCLLCSIFDEGKLLLRY